MSYGFLAKNDNGQIQASENTTNYAAIFSGSLAGGAVSGTNYYNVNVTVTGYTYQAGDLVVIRHNNTEEAGTYATLTTGQIKFYTWLSSSATISWKIMRRIDNVSLGTPSGYGIDVYKSNGTSLAFSSRGEFGVITNIFTSTGFSTSGAAWSGIQPWVAANVGTGQVRYYPGEDLEPTESWFSTVFCSTAIYGTIPEIDESGGWPIYVPSVTNTSTLTQLVIKTGV